MSSKQDDGRGFSSFRDLKKALGGAGSDEDRRAEQAPGDRSGWTFVGADAHLDSGADAGEGFGARDRVGRRPAAFGPM